MMSDKITPEERVKRFFFKYRDIFTQKLKKEEFKWAMAHVNHEAKNELVQFEGITLYPLLAAYLVKQGTFKNVQVLNAYKLIEIYLDKDETWKTVSDIECDILVITLGYAEFPNKQQGNIICQAIEQQVSRGGKFWLFSRGANGLSNYPEVRKCLEDHHFDQKSYQYTAQLAGVGDVQ